MHSSCFQADDKENRESKLLMRGSSSVNKENQKPEPSAKLITTSNTQQNVAPSKADPSRPVPAPRSSSPAVPGV